MIEVRELTKSYSARTVLNGLSLVFRTGAITGIAGPNACGKTTLLKSVLGLVLPDSGEIWIEGKRADARGHYRGRIGYMPQNPRFPHNLSLRELMAMLEDLRKQRATESENMVSYFELSGILDQPFGQLSGGTRQKVAAALAFMFDSPIIILDEPTAGLDPLVSIRFKDLLLAKARQGKTILLVSHFLTEIEGVAEDLVFLDEGATVYAGALRALLERTSQPSLEGALTSLYQSRKGSQT